jgi:hypothetical protein
VAAGALATLFNITCLTSRSATLAQFLPTIALTYPLARDALDRAACPMPISGHHFFSDATTAYFDLDTANSAYGAAGFKKTDAAAAPRSTTPGFGIVGAAAAAAADGMQYGTVPWLKLHSKARDSRFQEVYRVRTRGGNPPKTCAEAGKLQFEVQYSAEYWFYS